MERVSTWIGLGAASLACACGSPRDRPVDRSQPSATTPASASSPPVAIAPPASGPPGVPAAPCQKPFVVDPPYRDSYVDEAAALPAHDLTWSSRPMSGPFPTRDIAAPGCADVTRLPATLPFDEIVSCRTGDPVKGLGPGNVARYILVVRTPRGFWAHEIVSEHWPHRIEDGLRVAHVDQLAVADRLGDPGAEITALADEGPPGGAKNRHVLVCGLGPSGTPACLDVWISGGLPFHGPGSRSYRLTLACDGTLSIAGWEGHQGIVRVHGRGRLAFP